MADFNKAIRKLKAMQLNAQKGSRQYEALESSINLLEQLKKEEKTKATASWTIIEYEYFTCTRCGGDYANGCESTSEAREKLENREAYAFCPHCSAKMENGEPPRVKES